ncbi:5539_t:CDS:10 [Ambispora gerdemannii]|uniref:5539_t:CDS:1 n=1 Tax=Ambispora gerdemannii TaxID=144530 RepID=A0A9N9FZ49_9GLOM|nr:5539_t:CDS:10 [Ambispora gerdemannii]
MSVENPILTRDNLGKNHALVTRKITRLSIIITILPRFALALAMVSVRKCLQQFQLLPDEHQQEQEQEIVVATTKEAQQVVQPQSQEQQEKQEQEQEQSIIKEEQGETYPTTTTTTLPDYSSSPAIVPIKAPAPIFPFHFRHRYILPPPAIPYYHMPLQHLEFDVIHATGWDDNYPPEQLIPRDRLHFDGSNNNHLNAGVKHGKGWQSPRFCSYPQEIILQLTSGPARILKIQILSHHYKITSQLDIYVGSVQQRKDIVGMVSTNSNNNNNTNVVSKNSNRSETLPWDQMTKVVDNENNLDNDDNIIAAEGPKELSTDEDNIDLEKLNDEPYVHFRRLGYCSLDSNERAHYKARELKSVRLDTEGEYIRFVARKCHPNHLNQCNQVGIVGITVMGEPVDDLLDGESQTIPLEHVDEDVSRVASPETCVVPIIQDMNQWNPNANIDNKNSTNNDNNSTSLYSILPSTTVDSYKDDNNNVAPEKPTDFLQDSEQTATLVSAFGRAKEKAVKIEDFHLAKVFKSSIELVQNQKAIKDEDYDNAAKYKASKKIEEIKTNVQNAIIDEGIQLDEDGEVVVSDVNDIVGLAERPQVPPLAETVHAPSPPISQPTTISRKNTPDITFNDHINHQQPRRQDSTHHKSQRNTDKHPHHLIIKTDDLHRSPSPLNLAPKSRTSSNASRMNASDQEPLTPTSPTSHKATLFSTPADERPLPALSHSRSPVIPPVVDDDDELEDLSDLGRSAFALSVSMFGDRIVACLLSKKFKWRETALTEVIQRLDVTQGKGYDIEGVDKVTMVKAAFQVLQEGFTDSREKLTLQTITLWEALTNFALHHQVPQSSTSKLIEKNFPSLFAKMSDTNPRIKQHATDLFVMLAKTYRSPNQTVVSLVLKPSHSQTQLPKQAKAKVEIITRLVEEFGIAMIPKGKFEKDTGLSLEGVMEVAVSYLNHSNGEVRDAAVKLVVEVCRNSYSNIEAVKRYLDGVKPLIVDNICKLVSALPAPPPVLTMLDVDEELLQRPLAKRGTVTRLEQQLMEVRALVNNVNHFVADDYNTYIANTKKNTAPESCGNDDQVISPAQSEPTEVAPKVDPIPVNTATTKKTPAARTKTTSTGKSSTTAKKPKKSDEVESQAPAARKRSSSKLASGTSTRTASNGKSTTATTHTRRGSTEDTKSSKPSSKNSKPVEPPQPAPAPVPEDADDELKSDRCCIFCDEHNDAFTEENLVTHYWNDCPVLTKCALCNMILEISTLDDHMLNDCDKSKFVKQCPRCREVIPADNYLEHVATQSCMVIPSHIVRCPLCKSVVKPATEAGWKEHLLDADGCSKNRRKHRPTVNSATPVVNTAPTKERESAHSEKRPTRSSSHNTPKPSSAQSKTTSRKATASSTKDKTRKKSTMTRVKSST